MYIVIDADCTQSRSLYHRWSSIYPRTTRCALDCRCFILVLVKACMHSCWTCTVLYASLYCTKTQQVVFCFWDMVHVHVLDLARPVELLDCSINWLLILVRLKLSVDMLHDWKHAYIHILRLCLDWWYRTEWSGMKHNGMEWSGVEWNTNSVPLFGYSVMEWNKITTPSFGKRTEWNNL
jgi:hypothetical protein